MKKSTWEWVKKAEADHQAAVRLAGGREPFHDQVCFHCQQSAEKYLKALLEELGLSIPKIHNLGDILDLLLPHHGGLPSFRRGVIFLSDFAVRTRYPRENATQRQAA